MAVYKYISADDLLYYHLGLKRLFATQTALSSATDRITTLENTVDGIVSEGGEPNLINVIKLNSQTLPIVNKTVTIPVDNLFDANSSNPIMNSVVYSAISTINTQISTLQTAIEGIVDGVSSVNTKTGAVVLYATDISMSSTVPATISQTITQMQSDISGKANTATTLAGYGITDAYTKTQTDTAIATAIANVDHVSFNIVQSLPQAGQTNIIYLVPSSGQGRVSDNTNIYDEYIYINSNWEKIGTTEIDVSGFVRSSELVETTEAEIDIILAS